jgi:hypothetical protein
MSKESYKAARAERRMAAKRHDGPAVKRSVSHVRTVVEKVPSVLTWQLFTGRDGAVHCRPVGNAPQHARPVGMMTRSNLRTRAWKATVREMTHRRLGRMSGTTLETPAAK